MWLGIPEVQDPAEMSGDREKALGQNLLRPPGKGHKWGEHLANREWGREVWADESPALETAQIRSSLFNQKPQRNCICPVSITRKCQRRPDES